MYDSPWEICVLEVVRKSCDLPEFLQRDEYSGSGSQKQVWLQGQFQNPFRVIYNITHGGKDKDKEALFAHLSRRLAR